MPMIIAFVSQKGGVGKSTLARTLGAVVAHGGLSVLIADLDPKQSTSLQWIKKREPDDDIEIDVRSYEELEDALADGEEFEVVILDLPGGVSRRTLDVAKASHLLVLPTGPSVDDLHPTVLLHHELTTAGISNERIACAICRTLSKDEEADARDYLVEAGCFVLPGALPEKVAYRTALNQGRAMTETASSDLNERADALIESILNRIASQFENATQTQSRNHKGSAA